MRCAFLNFQGGPFAVTASTSASPGTGVCSATAATPFFALLPPPAAGENVPI